MSGFFRLAVLVSWIAAATASIAGELVRTVGHVVGGDTFDITLQSGSVRIRLCGIDSPEQGEAGYLKSKAALEANIFGHEIRCVRVGEGSLCDVVQDRRTETGSLPNASLAESMLQHSWSGLRWPVTGQSFRAATIKMSASRTCAFRKNETGL